MRSMPKIDAVIPSTTPTSMRKLFGTDGIRGVANEHPMTPELALSLGRAVSLVAGRGKKHAPRVLVGKDTRLSGYMIETAIASGVCAGGGRVMLCGPMPTPAVAHLTVSMLADAGVVISASHDPYEDNGIKIFGGDGFKLPDEAECEIERLMEEREAHEVRATGPGHRTSREARGCARPIRCLPEADVPARAIARRGTVVVDSAHGAAYRVAPMVLASSGRVSRPSAQSRTASTSTRSLERFTLNTRATKFSSETRRWALRSTATPTA